MKLSEFNNLRFEYSMGANVLMVSLVDPTIDKSILKFDNVSKIRIEYEYPNHPNHTGQTYFNESSLNFHINSDLIIITGLEPDSDINFTPYIILEENGSLIYKIRLTSTVYEHTLPYGNITYNLISTGNTENDNHVKSKIEEVLGYINELGTYIDENFDNYAQYAKTIPIKYNGSIQTASAFYYKALDSGYSNTYRGLVQTSDGNYTSNDTLFHELRHRYGISQYGTHLIRSDANDNISGLFNYILDDYVVINDAVNFECGRTDAKTWIFYAHSNIPEGNYTNEGIYNYLAANYIKALAWYTCHTTLDPNTSKIRIIAPISVSLIEGTIEDDTAETYYNITFNVTNGTANISTYNAQEGERVIISNIIPNSGYHFDNIIWEPQISSSQIITCDENGCEFLMPNHDLVITIICLEDEQQEEIYYNITLNTKNCTASISQNTAKSGDRITISNIIPNTGYKFQAITFSNISPENIFTISDGHTYEFIMGSGDTIINVMCIEDNQQEPDEGGDEGGNEGYIDTGDIPEYRIVLHQDHSKCKWDHYSFINCLSEEIIKANKDEEIIIYDIEQDDGYQISNIFVKTNYQNKQKENETIESVIEEYIENDIHKLKLKFIMDNCDCDVYFQYKEIIQEISISDLENKFKSNLDFQNINSKLKTIHLGPYQYLYEYLKNGEDFSDIGCSDNFVILRNFEIVNNIIYDKDIFFIEQSIYNKLIKNLKDDLIAYPLHKNGNLFFSNIYGFFTTYHINLKDIAYPIYDENNTQENKTLKANILCDKLRIYNPTINKNLDFIIYVDNYINNIHFHYFCNLNKNLDKKYIGEIKVNNNRYIEYIEVNIPNIKKLFSEQNKYFIIEDFNKIAFEKDFSLEEFFNKTTKKYDNKLYLSKIIKPFIIDKVKEMDKTIWVKTYIDDKYFNYNNNYINTSLNITLYPYKNISNGLYILHDIINPTSTFIEYESYFRLSSRLGFDKGIISLINEFDFPNKIKFDEIPIIDYKLIKKDGDNKEENPQDHFIRVFFENDKTHTINDIEDQQVTEYYNSYYLDENLQNLIDLHDDWDEELDVEAIRETGFVIQFANDLSFNDIILESIINTDKSQNENFIYDFSFSLNNMVESWNQLNDILVVRAKFIDKRLNNIIIGNSVVINKEWFKYFINDTFDYNIKFDKTNNLITNNLITNNLSENNSMDISYGFNFIDHINCVISEKTIDEINGNNVQNSTNISTLNNNIVNTKLIYKPIFYKVQDLQNIRIRQGITQNIGINLGDFLNKVSTFILNIGDQTIKESSRNDVFVIFSINANNIENNTGYYNIMNENYEYISSGNYIKY